MQRALGIAVLVFVAAFASLLSLPAAQGADVAVHLFGTTAGGWSNTTGTETNPGPTIVVNTTDAVTLTLTSDDAQPHQFLLDYNGNNASDPAQGEPLSSSFTGTTTLLIGSFPPGGGTYTYICLLHGWSTMRGTWIVKTGGGPETTPPWIYALAATPTNANSGGAVNLTASVVDNASNVQSVMVNVTGPGSFGQNSTMLALNATDFYFNRTYTENGTYTVTVWAEDNHNNVASRTITFTIGPANPPGGGNPASSNLIWAVVAVAIIVLLLVIIAWLRRRPKTESPPKPGGSSKE